MADLSMRVVAHEIPPHKPAPRAVRLGLAGDSDPDMDEALRRIRTRALKHLEIEAAYLERDHQLRSAVAREIATGIAA
jgi:hypothetical protein